MTAPASFWETFLKCTPPDRGKILIIDSPFWYYLAAGQDPRVVCPVGKEAHIPDNYQRHTMLIAPDRAHDMLEGILDIACDGSFGGILFRHALELGSHIFAANFFLPHLAQLILPGTAVGIIAWSQNPQPALIFPLASRWSAWEAAEPFLGCGCTLVEAEDEPPEEVEVLRTWHTLATSHLIITK